MCWPVTVSAKPNLSFTGETCQTSTYKFRGSNYPGTYNLISNGPTGTSCDTAITLVVSPIRTHTA
ncbi:MAG: hypothetical protein IPN87_12605 [Saprospiraceae bacterium]|nr:hypothetical protein [Candidatus Brachybacter algidus]